MPAYWEEAETELMKRDRIMKKLIPQFGDAAPGGHGDPFTTLARSIVGQQMSIKAAQTPSGASCCSRCPKMHAGAGAQGRRRATVAAAACPSARPNTSSTWRDHFKAKRVHADQWAEMDDEAVIAELVQIRGIGRWTAEMFLIFNLLRPNVLPLDDPGLIHGISHNYFSGEPVSRSDAREVAANWEPWRTVATWYLWRSLDPVPVE